MTTGVIEYPSALDQKSLEVITHWRRKKAIEEQTIRKTSFDRNAMAHRNNQKPLVISRRSAKCKPGLPFTGLGPWGF